MGVFLSTFQGMNGRLIDNGDIYLDGTSVRRAKSFKEKVMGLISSVLHTFQGECFVNTEAGVPWFDDILGNSVLFADEIGEELKDKIREISGVASVDDMMVQVDGRNISGKYKVTLTDGTSVSSDF